MTISVSDNTPRVSYSVSAGATQTSFTVSFEFFADADLNVYVDGTKKTLTTHYSVTGGDGSTGSISMSVTGASGGSTVVITRGIALERTTDFPVSGAFAVGTLNTELDRFVAIQADLNDTITRSIRLADDDAAVTMELPDKADRLGKVLSFNSSTGAVQVQTYVTPDASAGIDGVTAGTVAASKFLQVDANRDLSTIRNVTSDGTITASSFVIGSAAINENDLEALDDVTAGTVAASKAAIVDTNKDITGFRNITLTGELDAATLDISGDADIDGTLEADAITINGVTLAETIADTVGAMVSSNTETGLSVSYDDSDNTLDFVIGAGSIVNSMLADDAVGADELAANAVVTASIVDDNVTQAKIADDAVGADQLAASAVVTASIVDDNVTQAKIADDAVGADQLASSAVVTASIVDDAVTQAKIADDAVGADQLASNAVVNASVASGAAIADSKLDTISTANKVSLAALDIDGGTDIGAAIVDADLFIVDDGAGGTNRKVEASRLKTYIGTGDIEGVTAGTGLSGGGTSGTVTLNVDAAQTQITSVGALNAGSITSGFGTIDTGSSTITTTGEVSAGRVNLSSAVASGDLGSDAAQVGYSSTNGLLLMGQGSSSDISLYNDTGTLVARVPTGLSTFQMQTTGQVAGASGGIFYITTSESTVVANDSLGSIQWSATNEETPDGTAMAGAIECTAEGTFAGDANPTQMLFKLGVSEAATTKMLLSSSGDLKLTGANADANAGPILTLYRNSASPADGDSMGRIYFSGENDAGEEIQYVRFQSILSDASDSTEDSAFRLQTYVGGAVKSRVLHDPTETVINDDSADVDFRVESDSETHAFFVDAGSSFVAIGESSQVNGGKLSIATSAASSTLSLLTRSTTDAHQCEIVFQKSSTDSGNFAATADGESLGSIKFRGVDTQPVSQVAAEISVTQDGSESGTVPGKLNFSTEASVKWAIYPDGRLQGQSMADYTRMIELMGSGNKSATGALRLGVYGNNSQDGMVGGVVAGYGGIQFSYYYLLPQIQQTLNNGDLRLGSSSYRFHTVYASNALDTSDQRVKEEIENLDVGLDFIKALTPKKFKYADKDADGNYKDGRLDQTNGIKKWGLIAQEVKAVLDSNSISEDIGLWSTDKGECNGTILEDQQQLQYKELIAPLINAVKTLSAELDAAKERIAALENG
jgi:hypothetical protein